MSVEYKKVGATIKQVGDDGSFEAVIATFGEIDLDGDIVEHGAFGNAVVSVLPSHDSMHVPLGKTRIEERGEMAVAAGLFNLDIPSAKEWHSALKFDLANLAPPVQEWSWGFRIAPGGSQSDTVDGQEVRRLTELDMREVSPVLRGASVGTGTLLAKSESAHKTKTSEEPWDAPEHERRLTVGAKDSEVYALIQGDRGHFLHHEVDEKGIAGAASVRACVAGIAVLNGARGDFSVCPGLYDEQRKGVYDHLAGHLRDAGEEPPELGSKPGIKLVDQIRLATWDAESVLARIAEVSGDRPLGAKSKAAALEMAERHAGIMEKLTDMVEGMLPKDKTMRAAASFLASESARHLD